MSKWGYHNKTKWALIESAPLTATGLNEILATAETRAKLLEIAKLFRLKVSPEGQYQAVKLEDMKKKAEN